MTEQKSPSWIPLEDRTIEIRTKANEIFEQLADKNLSPTLADLYEDNEWGSLQQSSLYRGLIESLRVGRALNADEILEFAPNNISPDITPGHNEPEFDDTSLVDLTPDDVVGISLSWFVAHPPNPEKGIEASDILDQRILDLYVTHVNETGETYFPQLESQLRAYYELIANQ
jgi:hypothetical protein